MVEAVVRAFRRQRMLDKGVRATIAELAKREKAHRAVEPGAAATLLSPDIIEAILTGGV